MLENASRNDRPKKNDGDDINLFDVTQKPGINGIFFFKNKKTVRI